VHLPGVDLASADLSGVNISAHSFWQTLASIYSHLLAWILSRISPGFLCNFSPLVDAHVSVPKEIGAKYKRVLLAGCLAAISFHRSYFGDLPSTPSSHETHELRRDRR
jgi:hypothetical protein